ncbi:hypothetical protein A6V19_29505 [Escherichia coli]|nr:hypothetical protein A6V19_29505 [Escherichia coli]
MRFRVVCLLLTTSGEVVSFLFRITKKEIYMTKEEFVSYIFDKTVEMYAATYGSCNPLNKPEGKDDFDKIYRFLIDRNLNPKKIKKTPKNGCLFNTACVP